MKSTQNNSSIVQINFVKMYSENLPKKLFDLISIFLQEVFQVYFDEAILTLCIL